MVTVGRKNVSIVAAKSAPDPARVQSEILSKAKRAAKKLNPLQKIAKFLSLRILLRDGDIDFRQQQHCEGTFTYKQLKIVTRNFHPDNKIGEGGFGQVYKGVLSNGTVIAVKCHSSKSQQGDLEFMNEVSLISAVSHPSLVRLLGCCTEDNKLLLVYEYMENNSLSNALFGSSDLKSRLTWETRFKICLDIAKGLTYLHEESNLKCIHRDIKPSNILLDKDLNAKISDFGLAKLNEGEYSKIFTQVVGTNGYMAPEYAMRGLLTSKSDVYSFGVVVLELFSGKHHRVYKSSEEIFLLLDLAYVLQKKAKLLDLIDPDLNMMGYPKKTALRLLKLAMLCTDPSPHPRPNMSEVVNILEGQGNMKNIQVPARYMHDFQKVNVLADAFHSTCSGSGSGSYSPRDGTYNPFYTSGQGSAEKLDKPVQQDTPVLYDISDESEDVNDDRSISGATDRRGNKDDPKLLIEENALIMMGSPESSDITKSSTNSVCYVDYATKMDENNKSNKLEYIEPCFDEDGKLRIECSDEDFESRCSEWKDSLIGFVVGDKTLPPFNVDKEMIENLWGVKGDAVSMFSMKNGYFLFRFNHVEDKINVLESGPWHIEHRPLVLREWNWMLEFGHKTDEIKTLPIWVKIYDLPLIFWSGSFFSKVASSLGIPVCLDQKTKNKERLDYARICIEVDANKPLPESLMISFKGVQCEIKFNYDWKPLRCATCCTFGHEDSDCESHT